MRSTILVTSGLYFSPVNFGTQVETAAQNSVNPSVKAFDQKVIARVSAENK
jgi:aminopeptidase YwaD